MLQTLIEIYKYLGAALVWAILQKAPESVEEHSSKGLQKPRLDSSRARNGILASSSNYNDDNVHGLLFNRSNDHEKTFNFSSNFNKESVSTLELDVDKTTKPNIGHLKNCSSLHQATKTSLTEATVNLQEKVTSLFPTLIEMSTGTFTQQRTANMNKVKPYVTSAYPTDLPPVPSKRYATSTPGSIFSTPLVSTKKDVPTQILNFSSTLYPKRQEVVQQPIINFTGEVKALQSSTNSKTYFTGSETPGVKLNLSASTHAAEETSLGLDPHEIASNQLTASVSLHKTLPIGSLGLELSSTFLHVTSDIMLQSSRAKTSSPEPHHADENAPTESTMNLVQTQSSKATSRTADTFLSTIKTTSSYSNVATFPIKTEKHLSNKIAKDFTTFASESLTESNFPQSSTVLITASSPSRSQDFNSTLPIFLPTPSMRKGSMQSRRNYRRICTRLERQHQICSSDSATRQLSSKCRQSFFTIQRKYQQPS